MNQISKFLFLAITGLCLIIIFPITAYSQTAKQPSFTIVDSNGLADLSGYETALELATMDNFRLKDKKVVITFETGVKVELLSANATKLLGYKINPEEIQEEFPADFTLPVFALGANNLLLAKYHQKAIK